MPKTFWTIENVGVTGGEEKTLAERGIDDATATFVSQAEDTCDLSNNGRKYDAAFLFPFKSTVIIRRERERALNGTFSGGTPWFQGVVAHPTARASGRNERQSCSLIGPWWYLNERGFEQEYKIFNGWTDNDPTKDPTFITKTTSRIFLNSAIDLTAHPTGKLNTGEQLTEILTWARKPFVDAAVTPAFQIGTITLAVDAPIDEVKNITCAEAARKMLRWSPDAIAWFDHSTSPPTFHCKRRAELDVFNLGVSANKPDSIEVNPRYDLQRPFVRVQFERTNTIQGTPYLDIIEQIYPDPLPTGLSSQFGGVPLVIDLRGFTIARQVATIETRAIDTSSNDWWLDHEPEYKSAIENSRVTSLVIDPATVEIKTENGETDLDLPNELIGGAPADWIPGRFQRLTARVKARVKYANGGELPDKTFTFQFVSTDATSGSYVSDESEAGDAIPQNLARDLYDAVSRLPFEGRIGYTKAEVGGLPRLGHALNLLGTAQTDWTTMLALVQRTTETVQRGATNIEFGPPGYLTADDLVSLFRVARHRELRNPAGWRSKSYGGGSTATWGSKTARANSSNANGNWEKVVASGSPTPSTESDPAKKGELFLDGKNKQAVIRGAIGDGTILLAVGPEAGRAQGKFLQCYELETCEANDAGVRELYTRMFICSDRYKKPGQ